MKVLVVDDAIVFRTAITSALETIPGITTIKTAVNGKLALDILKLHPDIDLITVDMEMPVMDGLQTIKEIRKFNKEIMIIVFSSATVADAEKTINALAAGANDFVPKLLTMQEAAQGIDRIKNDLLPKILAFKEMRDWRLKSQNGLKDGHKIKDVSVIDKNLTSHKSTNFEMPIKPKLIVIGVSTGGPEALFKVFKSITNKISIPMLIVQHMPALFTERFALSLSKLSLMEVREAKNGDQLIAGTCLLAPGDFHMTINKNQEIVLDQNEKVCHVRPSVDVLLNSLAINYNQQILNIIMTGMGEDGAVGSKKLAASGAYTYIQTKETCVVWGMPGAVQKAIGEQARLISLDEIGFLINSASNKL